MISFKESARTKAAREQIGMPSKDSHQWGTSASPATILACSALALILYPIGAILPLLSDAKAVDLMGLVLVAVAAFACLPVFSSRLYKIASTERLKMDEFETQLRLKSIMSAYAIIVGLIGLSLFYIMVAGDTGLWLPTLEHHLNGIFWGFALYAMVLPVFVLSWRLWRMETDVD